ncbi:MAG: hypothetical protein ACLGSD_12360 [Acidobacteriota bacterium]
MHIVSKNVREWTVPAEQGQEGVEDVQVADDESTVGWLVDKYDSCCVSYAIPTELVVWRNGAVIQRFDHLVQAVFGWTFLRSGAELAYHQAPLHGDEIYDCTHVDVRTGKVLEEWWIGKTKTPPAWVELLNQAYPMPEPNDSR